jgi:amidase
VGSDYGGSVRLPSHCCGIVGIKPTSGRVPRTGHIFPFGGMLDAFQQIGPMARFVDDLALLLPILAGPDWIDPMIVPMPLRDPREVAVGELRVAFHTDNGILTPTPETAETIRAAASALERAGAQVEEVRPTGIEATYQIVMGLWFADGGATVRRLLREAGTEETSLPAAAATDALSAEKLDALHQRWDTLRSTMLAFLEDWDVILSPVNAAPALPHDESMGPGMTRYSYTMTYNLIGWPGAVVRGGTSPEGLPLGVQVVTRPWREDVSLAVARHLEEALEGFRPPAL